MRKLTLPKIFQAAFALILLYFCIRIILYHSHLIAFPLANTYREGAMMASTTALINGQNPYSFALQPQYTNEYGFVYPFIVWPLAQIFGTTLVIHRAVTALFILLCCAIAFVVMKRMQIPILLNISAGLMLWASLLFPGTSTPCVDPASTGLFFMLATIFIPWLSRYSYISIVISILCGLTAFYSKPYFLLGIPVIASYIFLFVSKKKGGFYGLSFLLSGILSIVIINAIFPAYFDNCFFAWLSIAPAWSTMERLLSQINSYVGIHKSILTLEAGILIYYICRWIISKPKISLNFKKIHSWQQLNLNLKDLKEPLIKIDISLVLYAGLWSLAVLLLMLGKHGGATLWYFFQLLSPFFLIYTAWLCSRFKWWPLLCTPFLVYNLLQLTSDEKYEWFNKNAIGCHAIYDLVSHHNRILNSPVIAPLLIEQNKEVFDNGQSEDFLSGGKRSPFMANFFKEDPRVFTSQLLYLKKLETLVQNKEFDLILIQASYSPNVPESIKTYYKMVTAFLVYVPQDRRPYMMTVWEPQ
ncbi:MAG: hypothetical protein WCH62_02615 [Candidatus Omnitrophota bacterium]